MANVITKYCPKCKRTSTASVWISKNGRWMFLICREDGFIIKEIELYKDDSEEMYKLEF